MALYNRVHTVLQLSEAADTDQSSNVLAIVPQQGGEFSFSVFVDLEQSGGAGAPTTAVHVETSHDGKGWIAVVTPISLNGDGETHEFKEVAALGPLIRARTALGGTTKPSHTATVKLAATADFDLKFKAKASADQDGGQEAPGEGPGVELIS